MKVLEVLVLDKKKNGAIIRSTIDVFACFKEVRS